MSTLITTIGAIFLTGYIANRIFIQNASKAECLILSILLIIIAIVI